MGQIVKKSLTELMGIPGLPEFRPPPWWPCWVCEKSTWKIVQLHEAEDAGLDWQSCSVSFDTMLQWGRWREQSRKGMDA